MRTIVRVWVKLKSILQKINSDKLTPLIGLALLIGIMGIMPHIVFSLDMGEISYFKSAYDEDFYIDQAINGAIQTDRLISTILVKIIYFATWKNVEATLILADFIFPFLCTISASFIASILVAGNCQRILIVIFLLFGQELLSLGSSAIWDDPTKVWSLSFWRSQFPPWGAIIIPDYVTSYFSLFRSPEPQISWIFLFIYLGILLKNITNPPSINNFWYLVLILLLNAGLAFLYIFIGFPLIVLQVFFASLLGLTGQKKLFLYIATSWLSTICVVALVYLNSQDGSTDSFSLIFSSRLPVITPAVLISLVTLIFMLFTKNHVVNKVRFILAFISISIPAILMNQQIITGLMISTKEWERYANYPFLIFGIWLFISSIKISLERLRTFNKKLNFVNFIIVVGLLFLLFSGQKKTYDQWYGSNELVIAQKHALAEVLNTTQLRQAKILIEEPGLEPLLAIKINKPIHFITDYRNIFSSFIQDMPPTGTLPSNQLIHRDNLFEFFARTAKTPSEVSDILKQEAMQKSGWYLGFLFSFKDFWYPATDNRLVRQDQILENIDLIVSSYKDYLKNPSQPWFDPTILLSKKAPQEIGVNPIWNNRLAAEGVAGQSKVYAYVQDIQSD
jgi:hypothetical protein